jgi:hypothetical protein
VARRDVIGELDLSGFHWICALTGAGASSHEPAMMLGGSPYAHCVGKLPIRSGSPSHCEGDVGRRMRPQQ